MILDIDWQKHKLLLDFVYWRPIVLLKDIVSATFICTAPAKVAANPLDVLWRIKLWKIWERPEAKTNLETIHHYQQSYPLDDYSNKQVDFIFFRLRILDTHDSHCYIVRILYLEYGDQSGAHSRSAILCYDRRFYTLLLTSSYQWKYCDTHTYILRSTLGCSSKNDNLLLLWSRVNSV